MVELKSLASKHLTLDSVLRQLILAEPDQLPRDEAVAKLKIFTKLLEIELASKLAKT